jgi:hypothetical protein
MQREFSHTYEVDQMTFTHRRKIAAISLFVMVAVMQTYVGVSFAARTANAIAPAGFQGASASLTTRQNKPVSVNGTDAITGATIVSGALIETPGQVGASVNIPGHAILDIEPDAKLIMEFDQNGNPKVTLREGCVTLHTKKGTTGEIDTIHGVAGKTDPAKDGVLRVCFRVAQRRRQLMAVPLRRPGQRPGVEGLAQPRVS